MQLSNRDNWIDLESLAVSSSSEGARDVVVAHGKILLTSAGGLQVPVIVGTRVSRNLESLAVAGPRKGAKDVVVADGKVVLATTIILQIIFISRPVLGQFESLAAS